MIGRSGARCAYVKKVALRQRNATSQAIAYRSASFSILPTANPVEQLFHCPWNDAHILFVGVGDLEPRAHGVGLAGAGLTIGQDGGIEPAIENMEIIIGSWKLGAQWVVSGKKHVFDAFGYFMPRIW